LPENDISVRHFGRQKYIKILTQVLFEDWFLNFCLDLIFDDFGKFKISSTFAVD